MTATDDHPSTPPEILPPITGAAEATTPGRQESNSTSPTSEATPPATPPEQSQPPPEAPSTNVNAPIATEPPIDHNVAALLAMFPDFDISLLESVLESVAGDQDRAVDVLLGMSDPSYTSSQRADATQTELDEEIARRLMLEESQQQQASWQPRGARDNVPYQPRSGAPHPNPQQPPAEGSDGVAQFQEQLGKFAETGKKTFNTFLSKVKAKIQEFDSPSGQGQPSGSTRPLPGGDSWSTPAQSQSYYDPNPPESVQGYDMGPTAHPPANSPATAAQPISVSRSGVSSSPPTAPGVPAPSTGNVDPAKLGLLPKRPVSLGSSPQPTRNNTEDDVEYVENPFEESAHR